MNHARRREFLLWFCSFLLASSILIVFFRIPWFPLCAGGVLTLVWTLVRRPGD